MATVGAFHSVPETTNSTAISQNYWDEMQHSDNAKHARIRNLLIMIRLYLGSTVMFCKQ